MFTDWKTAISAAQEFRNYDIEWSFIKWMDQLAEINCKYSCICFGEDLDVAGVQFFMKPSAENDNEIGVI